MARALGLPNDQVEATGAILEALREGRRRTIGLGLAIWDDATIGGRTGQSTQSRYFTFSAGMGYDAEVVRAVEGLRAAGYKASPTRYIGTALRHYLMTDRRHPALRLERPRHPVVDGIHMAIISNTAPWTYAGDRPVNPTPWAGFDTGLDMLGLRRLGPVAMAHIVRQIIGERTGLARGRHLVQLHDEEEFTLAARRPTAFQLDGDYLGERERVTFVSVPSALQVLV
jgi:diacylglycerol kinase family enzyme